MYDMYEILLDHTHIRDEIRTYNKDSLSNLRDMKSQAATLVDRCPCPRRRRDGAPWRHKILHSFCGVYVGGTVVW